MSIQKKVKEARIKFFRKDYGLQFFGALFYKFELRVEQLIMGDMAEGYVEFNKENLGESTGVIHANENMVGKEDYTSGNLIALISHELMHILERHAVRRGKRNYKIWGVATDHCIDRTLKEAFKDRNDITFYQNRYNIIDRLEKELPQCSAEEAYTWLEKNSQKISITCNGDGSYTFEDEQTGQQFTFVPSDTNCGKEKDNADDKAKTKEIVNNFFAEAQALYENLKQKGAVAGGLQEKLDNILKVEVPWEELVEKAIKKNTILKPDERSWRKLNNYYRPLGITLPGYSLVEDNEGVGDMIICADTSGSIDKTNLKKWAGIIMDSMKYFKRIILLVHDVDVQQIKEFDKDNIILFHQFIQKEGFQGRGGTSHKPVFNYIEKEHWLEADKRDDLSMIMCLTDGASDLESIYQNYEFIKNNTPIVLTLSSTWNYEFEAYNFGKIWIK